VLDDWFALADARFDGWWMAAGADQWRARPGAGVAYAVVFGLVGRHPLVALALQVALASVAAVLLWRLAVRFLGEAVLAWSVAALWVVLPNHSSLLVWASATNITLALVLLLAGLLALADGRLWRAGPLLAASVLCYEATAPVALAVLVAVPLVQRRPWRRSLAVGSPWVAAAGAWIALHPHPDKAAVHELADLGQVVPAHLGWGVLPRGWPATGAGLAATVALTLVLVEAVRTRRATVPARLAVTGAAVVGIGTLPFVRYFYGPLGFGDRVNVVAAVGTALLWAAVLVWSKEHLPAPVAAFGAVTLVAGFAVASWQGSMAWADAQDEAARTLASVRPVHAGDRVVVPRSTMRRNVAAFLDDSNWAGAVQLEAGTRDVDAFLAPAAGATPGG
jgi:hypothetical protein